MAKENTRQGFTVLGFSKSGFSACSNWHVCNYGKNGCVIADKDIEAADHCHCYQRNNRKLKPMTEIDDLFNSVNDVDIDAIFQSIENQKYLDRKNKEDAGIEERVRRVEENYIQTLSKMSEYDVLLWTVKAWCQMSASQNSINKALSNGDKDKAFHAFKKMLNESGSGGGMVSYFKFYRTIEIKCKDGRYFTPTEQELWDIYCSAWEEENTLNLFSFLESEEGL